MAARAFLTFFDKADGETTQKGKERWVELAGWSWGIDASTSWTKGGGANVGKPNPGALSWSHAFDTSSTVVMGYLCSGRAFPKVEVQMARAASGNDETYFTMTLEGVFITGVALAGSDDGGVVQQVEMVFKTIKIDYKPHDPKTGKAGPTKTFAWDIPAGTASPSA